MKQIASMAAVLLVAGCGGGKKNPSPTDANPPSPPPLSQADQDCRAANRLFVRAAERIEAGKDLHERNPEDAEKAVQDGLMLAQKLIEKYPQTDLAVHLVQGRELFDGYSISMLKDGLAPRAIVELPAGGGEPVLKSRVVKVVEIPKGEGTVNLQLEELTRQLHQVRQGEGGPVNGTRRGMVRFIRLRYVGGDWDQDLAQNSDLNMLVWYAANTGQKTAKLPEVRNIAQLKNFPKGKSPPLVYMTGQLNISLSPAEIETLREYLTDKHGMLFADNGGSPKWHSQFFALMRKVLPEVDPRPVPLDHLIHSGLQALPIIAPHGGRTGWPGWGFHPPALHLLVLAV